MLITILALFIAATAGVMVGVSAHEKYIVDTWVPIYAFGTMIVTIALLYVRDTIKKT